MIKRVDKKRLESKFGGTVICVVLKFCGIRRIWHPVFKNVLKDHVKFKFKVFHLHWVTRNCLAVKMLSIDICGNTPGRSDCRLPFALISTPFVVNPSSNDSNEQTHD